MTRDKLKKDSNKCHTNISKVILTGVTTCNDRTKKYWSRSFRQQTVIKVVDGEKRSRTEDRFYIMYEWYKILAKTPLMAAIL